MYDTTEVITAMDINENPGNSIEKYISERYSKDPRYCNTPDSDLHCIGTNKKFSFETILKYIFDEYKKRGIHVVSFGSDGDSRLLKAMQIARALKSRKCDYPFEVYCSLKVPTISVSWKTWFYLQNFSTRAHVQDIVHISLKLTCRVLKPSVLLPMGNW